MSKNITSSTIGVLTQDKTFQDWWESKEIAIPFFDNLELAIIFMDFVPEQDENFIKSADAALVSFLQLNSTDRLSISELAYKNCMAFLDAVDFDEVDEPLRQIKDENEIWNFIHPTRIFVKRRLYKDRDMYIQIACECDWEQEHGLQLVFRQGKKLTRISDQDGHVTDADAYDKPDEEDELLAAF